MTGRLYLLRHAKSSWEDTALADHDRPLAPRGRRASKLIAEHMRREGLAPALVRCSSARRTRETLERIAPALGEGVTVRIERELYGASGRRLLELLRADEEGTRSVLLIGHNPGIQELALMLARSGDKLGGLRAKYPTGALATLTFEGPWSELAPAIAELTSFVTPKQLARR